MRRDPLRSGLTILVWGAVGALVVVLDRVLVSNGGSGFLRPVTLVITPLLFAALLAYVTAPLVALLERARLPRPAAVLATFLLVIVAIGTLARAVVPRVTVQAARAADGIPERAERLSAWAETRLRSIREALPEESPVRERLEGLPSRIQSAVRENAGRLLSGVASAGVWIAGGLYAGVFGAYLVISYLVLVPFYTWFFLTDAPRLKSSAIALLPEGRQDAARKLTLQFHRILAAFFRGRLLIALAKTIVLSVGFTLAGLPFGLLLGITAGILSVVPIVGPLVGAVGGIGIALGSGSGGWGVIWVVAVLLLAEGAEALLTPLLFGREFGIHPVILVVALLLFGGLFGMLGVLLAVPIVAAAETVYKTWRTGGYTAPDPA